MPSRARPVSANWCLSGAVVGSLLLVACSGNNEPKVAEPAANQPKPAESIRRLDAPSARSVSLSSKLNTYRLQTFGTRMDVEHKNVLYTAAYRHAVYMNGINSGQYVASGATGAPPGVADDIINGGSTYEDFRGEATLPSTTATGVVHIFPALFTNDDLWSRITAVVGGPDLLRNAGPRTVNEFYLFDGTVLDTTSGDPGFFRGYNLDTLNNTNPAIYQFDAVDNIWYSRRGRKTLMRAALRSFGFATPQDGDVSYYPWPVLDGRFLGALTTVSQNPAIAQFGFWPNDGNTDVCPYGLDTDIKDVTIPPAPLTVPDVVRHQYSGPPIHITLPINEPFLLNTADLAGGIAIYFRKLPTASDTHNPQTKPNDAIRRYYTAFFTGLNGGNFGYAFVDGGPTAGDYDYTGCGNTETVDPGDETHNAELLIVPNEPLEPLSWYEVGVRLRTASYVLPGDTTDETAFFSWQFKTNDKTPY